MSKDVTPSPGLVQDVRWAGKTLAIRPIRGADEHSFLEFVRRLEPEDLRMRFFGYPHQLTHDELVRLTQVDEARELALVAVRTSRERCDEILGVARAVTEPDGIDAELGIIVRSDLKSEGLGRLLLHRLIAGLAGGGRRRLIAYVLHENLAMLALARSSGFAADVAGCDAQALCLVLDLGVSEAIDRARPQSIATRANVDDAQGLPPLNH